MEYCEKKGIYVITDNIYHKLVFDVKTWPSPYKFTKKDVELTHVIVVNGVSKLYGMTGFRIGWAISNRNLVSIMSNVHSQKSAIESLRLTLEGDTGVFFGCPAPGRQRSPPIRSGG